VAEDATAAGKVSGGPPNVLASRSRRVDSFGTLTTGGHRDQENELQGTRLSIEDRLFEWVDANPPPSDPSFFGRRAAKLFLTVLITALLGALPYGALEGGLLWWKRAGEEEGHQQGLNNRLIEVEKAAREGKTGEGTRPLFGIPEPDRPTDGAENTALHP
jgi:hypothetical protein